MEQTYTKDQILESYLNTIYLGESYYGVQVAAQGYFGKELPALSLRECAMLAGVTNSPYYYNPRRNFYTREKEGVDYAAITNNRTNYVLRCMYENQYITYEQYQEALNPATASVLEKDPTASTGMYP
ncbi:MAG: transglycosylase domain-containing protein, partial [Clostridia bacterium]|nr:transglycosylase domain-containing protein [Clostridia bacterium]